MAHTLKKGDIVHLKSGGPDMVVCPKDGYGAGSSAPHYSEAVNCIWMDQHGVCHEREFSADVLT